MFYSFINRQFGSQNHHPDILLPMLIIGDSFFFGEQFHMTEIIDKLFDSYIYRH